MIPTTSINILTCTKLSLNLLGSQWYMKTCGQDPPHFQHSDYGQELLLSHMCSQDSHLDLLNHLCVCLAPPCPAAAAVQLLSAQDAHSNQCLQTQPAIPSLGFSGKIPMSYCVVSTFLMTLMFARENDTSGLSVWKLQNI